MEEIRLDPIKDISIYSIRTRSVKGQKRRSKSTLLKNHFAIKTSANLIVRIGLRIMLREKYRATRFDVVRRH